AADEYGAGPALADPARLLRPGEPQAAAEGRQQPLSGVQVELVRRAVHHQALVHASSFCTSARSADFRRFAVANAFQWLPGSGCVWQSQSSATCSSRLGVTRAPSSSVSASRTRAGVGATPPRTARTSRSVPAAVTSAETPTVATANAPFQSENLR